MHCLQTVITVSRGLLSLMTLNQPYKKRGSSCLGRLAALAEAEVKCLSCKHENPRSNLQHPHEKPPQRDTHACDPSVRRPRQVDPGPAAESHCCPCFSCLTSLQLDGTPLYPVSAVPPSHPPPHAPLWWTPGAALWIRSKYSDFTETSKQPTSFL